MIEGEAVVTSTILKSMRIWAGAAAVATASAAVGQSTAMPAAPASAAVDAFYQTYGAQKIWFKRGLQDPAATQLAAILDRAAFDGFAPGPQLAAEVRAAAARAQSGSPADLAYAERVLSSAWVQYVQALKRPTPGMIYAYPVLRPQGTSADAILLTAAAAPALASHLAAVSDVNSVYKQLRDAGWAQAQVTGNFTPDPRLIANLDRVRSLPAKGRFLLVDSGTSMLTLYQDGQPLDSMKVITGTSELPTPLIASVMYYITYNPYWHAPYHLVRKTIAPNVLRQGMPYLKSHGYNVIDAWSENAKVLDPKSVDWKAAASGDLRLNVRQDPGPLNSMGILKFPFPNSEDIYLHDTPDHSKFSLANRNLSNGCVRVEDARRLGRWLLGQDPVAPGREAETRVQLPQGTPVYLTYITAQVKDGKLSYLPDVYGWDKKPPQFASN